MALEGLELTTEFESIDDVVVWMRRHHVAQLSYRGLTLVVDPVPPEFSDQPTGNVHEDTELFPDGVIPRLKMRK